MSYDFRLVHRSRLGEVKRTAITDFTGLTYRKRVNSAGNRAGSMQIQAREGHYLEEKLSFLDQLEVWWKNDTLGVPWHQDFLGLYMDPGYQMNEDFVFDWTGYFLEDSVMLGWRQVAWHTGYENRSLFEGAPAETVMKTIVEYNLGASALAANGRLRDGTLSDMGYTIQVAEDQGRGNDVTRSFANGNVGRILQETLAPVAGGDFSWMRIDDATWEFDFHPGQVGDDRSQGGGRVEFSLAKGNIRNVRYRERRRDWRTAAIVGGQGQKGSRTYMTVTGNGYLSSAYNFEMYVDARNESATGLQSAGEANLYNKRLVNELDFDVAQTPTVFYGPAVTGKQTYQLGDLVSSVFRGEVQTRQVTAVTVQVGSGGAGSSEVQFNIETEEVA